MIGGSVVLVVSVSLLYRLIRSDFKPKDGRREKRDDDDVRRESNERSDAGGGDQMSAEKKMSDGDLVLRPGRHSLTNNKKIS